ncbi:YceI family protein [Myroides sp. LJL115]
MEKIALLAIVVLSTITTFAQDKWQVDNYHSFLNFSVKHLGISFVDGRMDSYQGEYQGSAEDLSDGKFIFTIDVNSINTGVEMRDDHLKSADFFDTSKYPQMKFESTSIEKVAGDNYILNGILTIKGVSHPVSFNMVYGGVLEDDGSGNTKMGLQANTSIDRFQYNIDYDPSGQAIGKQVKINVNLEFTKQK